MSVTLRVLLLAASIIAVAWILLQIRKFKVKMEDAIFWVFFAAVLLVLAVFPEVSYWLSGKMGFMSPSNLVFLIVIVLLLEKVFTLSIIVSQMEEKISVLSAEVALRSQAADKRIDHREPMESDSAAGEAQEQEKEPTVVDSQEQGKGQLAVEPQEQGKGQPAVEPQEQGKGQSAVKPQEQGGIPASGSPKEQGKNRSARNRRKGKKNPGGKRL